MSFPFSRHTRRVASNDKALGAMNFLNAHQKMASLMPTVTRLMTLQQHCKRILPTMFHSCQVINIDDGTLLFGVPNAALASKLKQQLPNLQGELLKLGWQVSAIRLKVQAPVVETVSKQTTLRQLSPVGAQAFATLATELGSGMHNASLKAAIEALLQHARVDNQE